MAACPSHGFLLPLHSFVQQGLTESLWCGRILPGVLRHTQRTKKFLLQGAPALGEGGREERKHLARPRGHRCGDGESEPGGRVSSEHRGRETGALRRVKGAG